MKRIPIARYTTKMQEKAAKLSEAEDQEFQRDCQFGGSRHRRFRCLRPKEGNPEGEDQQQELQRVKRKLLEPKMEYDLLGNSQSPFQKIRAEVPIHGKVATLASAANNAPVTGRIGQLLLCLTLYPSSRPTGAMTETKTTPPTRLRH